MSKKIETLIWDAKISVLPPTSDLKHNHTKDKHIQFIAKNKNKTKTLNQESQPKK
ncbi:uncharacterized protein DS421_17g575710 [Arachis hypogaea]|nr:uncharacterized protein DS421_17g575710 [Arachis hypogaea]